MSKLCNLHTHTHTQRERERERERTHIGNPIFTKLSTWIPHGWPRQATLRAKFTLHNMDEQVVVYAVCTVCTVCWVQSEISSKRPSCEQSTHMQPHMKLPESTGPHGLGGQQSSFCWDWPGNGFH